MRIPMAGDTALISELNQMNRRFSESVNCLAVQSEKVPVRTCIDDSRMPLIGNVVHSLGLPCSRLISPESALSRPRQGILILELEDDQSLAVQKSLRQSLDPTSVVYVVTRWSSGRILAAMQQAAVALLGPDASTREISDAIRYSADCYTKRAARLLRISEARKKFDSLSKRQKEVAVRITDGLTNKAVGRQLFISVKTVEKHRAAIHERTGTQSLPDLIKLWCVAHESPDLVFDIRDQLLPADATDRRAVKRPEVFAPDPVSLYPERALVHG